uniref:Potassium channel subfamily K member 18 n=1 Tax=Schistocephalus solidus TaxID=70667 RepID=A0A0X3NKD4_SCHSO
MLGRHLGAPRSQEDHLGLSRFFGNFSAGFALASRPPTNLLEKVTYVQKADKRRQKIKKIRTGFKRFLAFIFSQIGLSVLVVGYTVLGGLLFRAVELEHEKMVKLKGKEMRDGLADKISSEILRQLRYHLLSYDTQTHSYYKLPKREHLSAGLQANGALETLRKRRSSSSNALHQRVHRSSQNLQFDRNRRWLSVIDYTLRRKMRQELHGSLRKLVKFMDTEGWNGEDSPDDLKWSWEGSILFAVTVITTIGYGHAVPKTNLGKLLTIGYALIGIPLVFLYLSNIGDYLATLFRTLYSKICRRCCEGNCLKSSQLKHAGTSLIIWNSQAAEMEVEEQYGQDNPETFCRSNLRILKRIGATPTHLNELKEIDSGTCTTLMKDGNICGEKRNDVSIKVDIVSDQNLRTEMCDDIRIKTRTSKSKPENTPFLWNSDSKYINMFGTHTKRNGKLLPDRQLRDNFKLHNTGTQTVLHADPSDEITSKSLLKSFATCRYLLCYQQEKRLLRNRCRQKRLSQRENPITPRNVLPAFGDTTSTVGCVLSDQQPPIPVITSCPTFSIDTEDNDEVNVKSLTNPDSEYNAVGCSRATRKLHSSLSNENDVFFELTALRTNSSNYGNASTLSKKNTTGHNNETNKKHSGSSPLGHQCIRKLKANARGSSSSQACQKKRINPNRCTYSDDLDRSRLSMLASVASSTSDMQLQVSYYSRDSLQSLRWSDAGVRELKTSALSQEDISNVTVPISLSISIMTTYILIGAIVFCIWEDDNYLKWSYFCFVTLSTIGFGDIVPGTKVDSTNPQEKLIIISLYVAIGLSVFAMCFKLMQEEVVSKCKWLGHKIGLLKHRVKKQKLNFPQPRDIMTSTQV